MTSTLDLQIACTEQQLPSAEQFQQWVDTVLVSNIVPAEQSFELTIRIVGITESQQLNLQYRAKDKPTNVLSFPFDVPDGIELNLLGDLVICVDIVKSEAEQQNKALDDHWAHLVIHGCLHLLGFDHISDTEAEEMESLEIDFLAKLNITTPYET